MQPEGERSQEEEREAEARQEGGGEGVPANLEDIYNKQALFQSLEVLTRRMGTKWPSHESPPNSVPAKPTNAAAHWGWMEG